MRYLALITDYDGTLSTAGNVSDATATAVQRLQASGRHVILATGRRLDDLLTFCPFIEAFSYVVAENGALAYEPSSRETTLLAEPAPAILAMVDVVVAVGRAPLDTFRQFATTSDNAALSLLPD